MGCSNQKNIEVDDTNKNKNKTNKNQKKDSDKSKKGKESKEENKESEEENENEESERDSEEEELEMGDEDNIEKLKKKHMIHEYYFLPTKDIPKIRFVKRDIDKVLPSDFAGKEKNKKDKQYFCFIKNKSQKNNHKIIHEEETGKNQNLIEDKIYLFNQKMRKVKSIKPLKREEILKPYNYEIECDINEDDKIIDKKSNKEKGKYDYLDMFPNGEAYKFVNNEEEPKNEKPKIVLPQKNNIEDKKIELIKKNDVNDIVNIINKELKENGLIDNNKKNEKNDNDF